MARRRILASLGVALLLEGSIASVAAAKAPERPAAARVRTDEARAIELVRRAAELYRAKKYVEAAVLFGEAYALSKLPNQLRNAAKAYLDGGKLDDALPLWREYAAHPKIADAERAEATAQIALIEERQRAEKAIAEAEAAKQAAREAEARRVAAEAERRGPSGPLGAVSEGEGAARGEARRAEPRGDATPGRETAAGGELGHAEGAERSEARPEARADVLLGGAAKTSAVAHTNPTGAYVVFGAGVVLALAAGGVFTHASLRLSDLDAKLAIRDRGLVSGVPRAEAVSELSGINGERTAALVLGAGAIAAAGTALVWLLSGGDAAEVTPEVVDGSALGARWSGTW